MAQPFLRFENGKISLNNKDLMVNSAQLSINPSLQEERVYGDYDASISGAKTEFINFAATSNLKGQLNISFYISSDVISPNSVDRLFELVDVANPDNNKKTISEAPIHGNIVGRYIFDNMYLTSFNFTMSPFQLIVANATYDIYGTISRISDRFFTKSEVDFAHALKSFGEIKISGQQSNDQLEVQSLSYNISVERKISNQIRVNETSSANVLAGGVVPSRVSVNSIVSEVSVKCNEMIENLNSYGDQQNLSSSDNIPDSSVDIYLYGLTGERISRFRCSGKIDSQSFNIQEGANASSSIKIRQVIR